jgi:hypothetical protein
MENKDRTCPKCKAVNPPSMWNISEFHDSEHCRHVIEIWYLFGFIPIKKHCNSLNFFQDFLGGKPQDDWIYGQI